MPARFQCSLALKQCCQLGEEQWIARTPLQKLAGQGRRRRYREQLGRHFMDLTKREGLQLHQPDPAFGGTSSRQVEYVGVRATGANDREARSFQTLGCLTSEEV